jgi:hypothetical protein
MGIDEYMQFYYTKTFTKIGWVYDKADAEKKLSAMISDWDIELWEKEQEEKEKEEEEEKEEIEEPKPKRKRKKKK